MNYRLYFQIMIHHRRTIQAADLTRITSVIEEIREEAYQRGFHDGIAAVKAAAENVSVPNGVKYKTSSGSQPPADNSPFEAGSTVAGLYDYIKAHPGLKPIDVIRQYQKESGKSFHENYGRSAIIRIKEKGYIETRDDGRLY